MPLTAETNLLALNLDSNTRISSLVTRLDLAVRNLPCTPNRGTIYSSLRNSKSSLLLALNTFERIVFSLNRPTRIGTKDRRYSREQQLQSELDGWTPVYGILPCVLRSQFSKCRKSNQKISLLQPCGKFNR
jgi:hypothetical protein